MKKTFQKILLLCLAVIMLFLAVACKKTPSVSTTPEQSQIPEEPQKTYQEVYADIISQYTALLTAKQKGETLVAPNTEGMDADQAAIVQTVFRIVEGMDAKYVERYGYGYKDYDGNGIPELLLFPDFGRVVMAIFTVSNGKAVLLASNLNDADNVYFSNSNIFFSKSGCFLMKQVAENGNIETATYSYFRVAGDKLAYESVFGEVYDYEKKEILENFQMVNGERVNIDCEAFMELGLEYTQIGEGRNLDILKLQTPCIYLPLVDQEKGDDRPVADFSSYAAIIETVKAISEDDIFDSFHADKWRNGKYDHLYACPTETDFDYYNRFLYILYRGSYSPLGYDEIDLNGDGKDELVFLTEDYTIEAVFTQKNGTPVMLKSLLQNEEGWLDEDGYIHIDRGDINELEYSVYKVTESGDFELVYDIFVAEDGNRYLTKDGKKEKITFEESLEIYDEYCCYPERVDPNEYTRTVSDLTYVALTEPYYDPIQSAAQDGISWHSSANWDGPAGTKTWFMAGTYVTFENLTEDSVDVNFEYVLTKYYPDPDRENYSLSETTESSLKVTAHRANGFYFEEGSISGRIEFHSEYIWIIIEESADERFPEGYHCYRKDIILAD